MPITGDSGTARLPTPRAPVFPTGMPATVAASDYATETNTAARPDTFNPQIGTNPPSATPDPGSA